MRFISHINKQQSLFCIPEAFQKIFPVELVSLPHDPFSTQTPLFMPAQKCAVVYSLHKPLPQAFLLNACHSNKIVEASKTPQEADAHFVAGKFSARVDIVSSSSKTGLAEKVQATCTLARSAYTSAEPTKDQQVFELLAIRTADCLPVVMVFENKDFYVGAVVHAGWRGYSSGILKNSFSRLLHEASTLQISRDEFVKNLKVHIGPAIFGISYECGDNVKSALKLHKKEIFETPLDKLSGSYFFLDLYENLMDVNTQLASQSIFPDLQLLAALEFVIFGILEENIEILRENTYSHPVLSSYREATHQKSGTCFYQWTHLRYPKCL